MATRKKEPVDLANAVLLAFSTNERLNQYLLGALDEGAWRAAPPAGKGRTVAEIVAHVHNVRHLWLTVSAKGTEVPEKVDRRTLTRGEARIALAASARALSGVFSRALENGGHVPDFKPDVVGFLGYVLSHEAHHRGQICLLARQTGFPLPEKAGFELWDWGKRAREVAGEA